MSNGDHEPDCPAYYTPINVPKYHPDHCKCLTAVTSRLGYVTSAPRRSVLSRDMRCDQAGWPDPRWHCSDCQCDYVAAVVVTGAQENQK